MEGTKIQLVGDEQTQARFALLELHVRTKIVKDVLSSVSRTLVSAIKGAAPVRTTNPRSKRPPGNLRKSIGYKNWKVGGNAGASFVYVGPKWPLGAHGHLVEDGTKPRRTKRGVFRGVMPKHPFVTPAYEARRSSIESAIATKLKLAIDGTFSG